jgi:hypothetical protein
MTDDEDFTHRVVTTAPGRFMTVLQRRADRVRAARGRRGRGPRHGRRRRPARAAGCIRPSAAAGIPGATAGRPGSALWSRFRCASRAWRERSPAWPASWRPAAHRADKRAHRPHLRPGASADRDLRMRHADRSKDPRRDSRRGQVPVQGPLEPAINGTAPLPVWSSNKARHRLSRTGNRQLNAALHRVAMTQAHWHPPRKT